MTALRGDDARSPIRAGLSDEQGLLYRYRADDGLEGAEGAFLLCAFWLVEALATSLRLGARWATEC